MFERREGEGDISAERVAGTQDVSFYPIFGKSVNVSVSAESLRVFRKRKLLETRAELILLESLFLSRTRRVHASYGCVGHSLM